MMDDFVDSDADPTRSPRLISLRVSVSLTIVERLAVAGGSNRTVVDATLQEQKLWLTLFQVKALQKRLNLLTLQFWLFSIAAILMIVAAAIMAAARLLTPLLFLTVGIAAVILGVSAIAQILRAGGRSWATLARAAMIADQRAGLKGRLLTVVAVANKPSETSLWSYLIEDAYSFRHEFEPSRIEPRWVSRTILALAGVGLAAFLLAVLQKFSDYRRRSDAISIPADVTANLSDLDIQPADPALGPNARLYADSATLRQLQSKLAANSRPNGNSPAARWMERARSFAGSLQDELTGRRKLVLPPFHLRLTNKDNESSGSGAAANPSSATPGSGHATSATAANGGLPAAGRTELPQRQSDRMANNRPDLDGQGRRGGQDKPDASDRDATNPGAGFGGVSGSTHAEGSDPSHLFGPPQSQELGSDSFRVTIDAKPADEASARGVPAYIPPKIEVPLNAVQAPDQPIARAAVPPEDQMTIKRVFER